MVSYTRVMLDGNRHTQKLDIDRKIDYLWNGLSVQLAEVNESVCVTKLITREWNTTLFCTFTFKNL